MRPKASGAGLICRTDQCFQRQTCVHVRDKNRDISPLEREEGYGGKDLEKRWVLRREWKTTSFLNSRSANTRNSGLTLLGSSILSSEFSSYSCRGRLTAWPSSSVATSWPSSDARFEPDATETINQIMMQPLHNVVNFGTQQHYLKLFICAICLFLCLVFNGTFSTHTSTSTTFRRHLKSHLFQSSFPTA